MNAFFDDSFNDPSPTWTQTIIYLAILLPPALFVCVNVVRNEYRWWRERRSLRSERSSR